MASSDHILYESRGAVALITLNRPEKRNALTMEMDRDWARAIERANADADIGAIVVTGAGAGFCAGADFKERFKKRLDQVEREGSGSVASGIEWVELVRRSKPLIAAVNGPAMGMGLTLILPFDIIVASRAARFAAPFVKVGLVPELASSHFLVSRMGFGRASAFILTGETIGAEDAVASGLADVLVSSDRLVEDALALAGAIAANPAPQLAAAKALLTQNAVESDLHAVTQRESAALEEARRTPEHKAAIDRFLGNSG